MSHFEALILHTRHEKLFDITINKLFFRLQGLLGSKGHAHTDRVFDPVKTFCMMNDFNVLRIRPMTFHRALAQKRVTLHATEMGIHQQSHFNGFPFL